jgi:hypothetical protein
MNIIFDGFEGKLMNDDLNFLEFLNKVCGIDTTKYDKIYSLNDNWAGRGLLIKGNQYRYITFGSGRPIVNEKTGFI